MKKNDFKFNRDDLSFWRGQTKDLKNQSELETHSNITDETSNEFLELKLGREEILNFRKEVKKSLATLPDLVLGDNSVGIDKNTQRKFRTGKMPIDATLDMHGMTQAVAFNSFISFINNSFEQGNRCLIVITGKGFFSKNGGILKQSLPIWVNNDDVRSKILSFSQALPTDGGSGAFYLFLKRKR